MENRRVLRKHTSEPHKPCQWPWVAFKKCAYLKDPPTHTGKHPPIPLFIPLFTDLTPHLATSGWSCRPWLTLPLCSFPERHASDPTLQHCGSISAPPSMYDGRNSKQAGVPRF